MLYVSEALHSDSPFSGKDVFGFKTPKRSGALAQAGQLICKAQLAYNNDMNTYRRS